MKKLVFLSLVLALSATGCKKGGKSGKAADNKPAAPVKLDKLDGLSISIPSDAKVGDGIGGGVMIQGGAVGAMTLEAASAPKTMDEGKSDADMYGPKNLKTETLPDGWALTFENSGGAGTNYWVAVQRQINGKAYTCGTTGSSADQQAAVLAACKSLSK